jgi:DNA polymerase-3 subunit epsilon
MNRFVAIDVETANPRMSSICQLGLCVFENGILTLSESTLIDPCEEFSAINIGIHAITASQCSGAPKFSDVCSKLLRLLNNEIVVCHSPFDRVAIGKACGVNSMAPLACHWIDTVRVARTAWPQFVDGGFGLQNIASSLGINFKHHDAQEDARACGEIMLQAMTVTGIALENWVEHQQVRIQPDYSQRAERRPPGNVGPLMGETMVFTGNLEISRSEAADRAHACGCAVGSSVTKQTTILVVGDQDLSKLAGKDKSSKHIKAEKLIAEGQHLRILAESDFIAITASHN